MHQSGLLRVTSLVLSFKNIWWFCACLPIARDLQFTCSCVEEIQVQLSVWPTLSSRNDGFLGLVVIWDRAVLQNMVCNCRSAIFSFLEILEFSFNSSWLLVGSWLFCLQNFPCLVSFRCMCWRSCGGLNKEHSIWVHWRSNSFVQNKQLHTKSHNELKDNSINGGSVYHSDIKLPNLGFFLYWFILLGWRFRSHLTNFLMVHYIVLLV